MNVVLVDFSFAKYVEDTNVTCVNSFLAPPTWRRVVSLFTHKVYLQENPDLESSISDADVIILFDTRRNYDTIAKRIEKFSKPNAKLIWYSWNPASDSDAFTRLGKQWIKTSFSKRDAMKFHFQYVGSFYFKSNNALSPQKYIYDGLFIGQDKGRRKLLEKVSCLYAKNDLISKVILVDNRKALFNRRYSHRFNYDNVCELVKKSKSIIEILQDGQEGVSLRVFEALFNHKKLVTNNRSIVNYDIYNSQNIFILGVDDENRFKDFLCSPLAEIDKGIVDEYKMNNWIAKMQSL